MDKVHYNQIDYLVSCPILKRQPGYNGEASKRENTIFGREQTELLDKLNSMQKRSKGPRYFCKL
jgi:hypothetical protein